MAAYKVLHREVSTFIGALILLAFVARMVLIVSNVGNAQDVRSKASTDLKYQVVKQIVSSLDDKRIFTRACNATGEEPINFSACDPWTEVIYLHRPRRKTSIQETRPAPGPEPDSLGSGMPNRFIWPDLA